MRTEARWSTRSAPPSVELGRALGLSPIVAGILAARGYAEPEHAARFLNAGLEDLTPADALPGLDAAADVALAAAREGRRVTVYGDYDADGVCATAILIRTFRAVGVDAQPYLPHRMREGYGLAAEAVRELAAAGTGLLLTVDCGVGAVEEIALARSLGLRTIVLDHHEPPPALPDADVLVDLKTQDAVFREYCAAGLAWRFAGRIRARCGLPPTDELLELAAIATVADVVPLVGDNRTLARHGLARLARSPLPGLRALLTVAGVNSASPSLERDVGWRIAPRLNAAGRIESAEHALALLLTEDAREAARMAAALDETNRRRQIVNDQVLAEAVAAISEEGLATRPGIVVWGEGWHPGVVGIAAGRVREAFHRPVVLLSVEGGLARGSARGIPGLNLVDALQDSRDLLERFGGHAAAAGVALRADRLPAFRERFEASVRARVDDDAFAPRVDIDAEIAFEAVDEGLAADLDALRPYGPGNREPVLAIRGARVANVAAIGAGEHLRLTLTDGRTTRDAVAFRQGALADLLLFTQPRVDVAFRLERRFWQGRHDVQCVVDALRAPDVEMGRVLSDASALVRRLFEHRDDYLDGRHNGAEDADVLVASVAGTGFEGRQDVVRSLAPRDGVALVREPDNPRDPHAVRVAAVGDRTVGYLSRGIAGRLAPEMDRGVRYRATVERVTAGGRDLGADVRIEREDGAGAPGRSDAELLRLSLADDPDAVLLRRLSIHMLGGRGVDARVETCVRGALARERRAVMGPPGTGAWAAIVAAAAARAVRGGQTFLVFPTVELLEIRAREWRRRLAAVGVRSAVLHGLMSRDAREAVLEQAAAGAGVAGGIDVLFATADAYERRAGSIRAGDAALIGDGWTDPSLPTFAVAHDGPVLWNAWTTAAADGFAPGPPARVRTNVRVADRRGRDAAEDALATLLAGEERVLAFATTAGEAVAAATALRAAHPHRTDRIAYDHDGLPARVRETLYGLLSAGRLQALVCAGAPGEEAGITGVRNVVWLSLPEAWHTFLVQTASAGAGRDEVMLHLTFDDRSGVSGRARLAERHPPRAALAALYRALRDRPERIVWPDTRLIEASAAGGGPLTGPAIDAGLRILDEAGILSLEPAGDGWAVAMAAAGEKRNLTASARYSEGEAARCAFEDGARRLLKGTGPAILEAAAGVAVTAESEAG